METDAPLGPGMSPSPDRCECEPVVEYPAATQRVQIRGSTVTEYLVIYEEGEDGGWGAHSPDVAGVFAAGATRGEVEALMTEALAAHLDYPRDEGKPIAKPRTHAGHVAA
jgi:predicted RNase H-like HicB family nuclease